MSQNHLEPGPDYVEDGKEWYNLLTCASAVRKQSLLSGWLLFVVLLLILDSLHFWLLHLKVLFLPFGLPLEKILQWAGILYAVLFTHIGSLRALVSSSLSLCLYHSFLCLDYSSLKMEAGNFFEILIPCNKLQSTISQKMLSLLYEPQILHVNGPLRSVEGGEFFEQRSDCKFLKEDCSSWSYSNSCMNTQVGCVWGM
jgi:hypothetical protein